MKNTRRYLTTALLLLAITAMAFAASPTFSLKLNGAIGAYNIQNNPTIKSVPGLSDNSDLDLEFGLKGSFGKEASFKGAGYNSGMRVDVDSLYRNYVKTDNYVSPDSRYANNYTQIQKMIDWYEANKHYYGLPDNPFGEKGWPEGRYGEGRYSYKFINGTAVEDVNDVDWTNSKAWAAAEALYHDVKSKIEDALEELYHDKGIAVGNTVRQDLYAEMDATQKYYAERKMDALNSFKALTSNKTSYPVASGYVEFYNIGGMLDISADIANARLESGKLISSNRTGQTQYGSSVSFGLTRDFIKGLNAELAVGIAGGVAQRPEMWDTQCLDYNPGKYGELAVKLNTDYTYELNDLNLDITSGFDFTMQDLLIAPLNNSGALRLGVHYNDFSEYIDSMGFYLVDPTTLKNEIEVADNFEFVYAFTKDRYDINDKNSFTFALKNELFANAYGVEVRFDTTYKAPGFESKYRNQIEDRFFGRNINADFNAANLKGTALLDFDVAYSTFRLFNTELATVNAGIEALIYGKDRIGLGWNAGVAFNLVDYIKQDFIIDANISWYKNTEVKTFKDMETLPKQTFMDFATISAGIKYEPIRGYKLGLEFVTEPSTSRRNTTRITSVEATVSISY